MNHLSPIIDPDPEAMSRRARIYIMAGGIRQFLIGTTILALPWLYSAAAFIPIFNLLDQAIWGGIMTVVGVVCIAGAVTRNTDLARAGMVGSAVVTTVLAVGISFGLINVWIAFAQNVGVDAMFNLIKYRPRLFPIEMAVRMMAPPSPFLALLLLSVSIKDFTMCAQPLRVPFEDRARAKPAEA